MQQNSAATMRVEGMYDPTVETYVFEDISLICKVEKILVVNTGDKIDLQYACVNELGQREVLGQKDTEEEFNLTLDRCITEYALEGVLCNYEEEYYSEIMSSLFDGLRRWEAKGVKLDNGTIVSFDEYYKDNTQNHSHDDEDDAENEDETLAIESRNEMVGVPLAGIPFYDFDLKITPEEAEKLDGEIEVAFKTGGPYFASRNAAVKWTGALNVDNLTLNLYRPLYDYHDALYRLWEENDYGHSFEDFVIEVFDMKIKKYKVAILIELGS